eukprot:1138034-Pelagomonas_calceolata.AAC.1
MRRFNSRQHGPHTRLHIQHAHLSTWAMYALAITYALASTRAMYAPAYTAYTLFNMGHVCTCNNKCTCVNTGHACTYNDTHIHTYTHKLQAGVGQTQARIRHWTNTEAIKRGCFAWSAVRGWEQAHGSEAGGMLPGHAWFSASCRSCLHQHNMWLGTNTWQ